MRYEQFLLSCLVLLGFALQIVSANQHFETLARRGSGSGSRSPSPSKGRSGSHSPGSSKPNLELTLGRPTHTRTRTSTSSHPNLELTLGRPGTHAHSSGPQDKHVTHQTTQSTHAHAVGGAQSHLQLHSGSKRPAEASHTAHQGDKSVSPPAKKATGSGPWWKKAGGQPGWPSPRVKIGSVKAGPIGYHQTGPVGRHQTATRGRESPQQRQAREKKLLAEHPSGHQLHPSKKGGGPGSPGAGSHAVSRRRLGKA